MKPSAATEGIDIEHDVAAAQAEFDAWLLKRNNALREMDMNYAAEMMPGAAPEVQLLAMHKARYECTVLEPEYRHASRAWLAEHGYGRMSGGALLPEGELPE